jgi:hypothetical protein
MSCWDVTELSKADGPTRKGIDANPDYLRLSVVGLDGVKRAK